MIKGFCFTRY